MFEVTYHGVQSWFKAEVEKFGWMIVFADSESVTPQFKKDKLTVYLKSLDELLIALKDVLGRHDKDDLCLGYNPKLNYLIPPLND